jgi:hypothetical protein
MIRLRLILFALLAAAFLSGCSSGWFDDFIGEPSPTPRPTQEAQVTLTPEPTPVVLNITDLSVGLEGLASYRVDFTATFEYVDMTGTAVRRLIRYQYFHQGPDTGYYLRVSDTNDPTRIFQQSGIYQIGSQYYQIYGTDETPVGCSMITQQLAQPLQGSRFTPEKVIGVLTELALAEEAVAVNGVLANRFTYTQENQNLVDYTAAYGEVWVARTEGFILRLNGQGQGYFELVGHSGDGLVSWEYLLSEMNTLEAVALPEICDRLGVPGILLPDEAEINNQREGFVSFSSPDSPAVVADFFRQSYPSSGWTLQEDAVADATYVLTFTLNERKIYITISPEGAEGALVVITE